MLSDRLCTLVKNQLNTYSSAKEFRNRAKEDIDALLRRELWAFVQRVSRRSDTIEEQFRSWVQNIRSTVYEVELPHGVLEFLSRPGGIFLSIVMFFALAGAGGAAIFYMRPSWLENSLVLAAFLLSAISLTALVSVAFAHSICMSSWRAKLRHQALVAAGDLNLDSLAVGAVPLPEGLSAEERAGVFGTGAGALSVAATVWLGVEPITGLIATGLVTAWGWMTGKSLKRMRRDAVDAVSQTLDMRLDDFLDGFAHELLQGNRKRLQRMRELYWMSLGPDVSLQTEEAVRIRIKRLDRMAEGAALPDDNTDNKEPLLHDLRALCFEHGVTNIYVHPKIPEHKLGNAVGQYAKNCRPSDILLLYDATVFGSAREGLCLTKDSAQWNLGESTGAVRLGKLTQISSSKEKGWLGGVKIRLDGNEIHLEDLNDDAATTLEKAVRIICRANDA